MAKNYEFDFIGQANFYSEKERSVKMYFSEPENGVNEETGILLIIAGYGGNSNSNIYKKMRMSFADEYNLVTLQCDYMGWEFMQLPATQNLNLKWYFEHMPKEEYEMFLEKANKEEAMEYYNIYGLKLIEDIKETSDNYNEQGCLQAIDNLDALKILIDILDSNGFLYNKKKMIAYGHSHGAYLAYLCNIFQPDVFSMIIDNSSYLFPLYVNNNRYYSLFRDYEIDIIFKYMIATIPIDTGIYDINKLYTGFKNKAKIISFHGANDKLISLCDKEKFILSVTNAIIEVIHESNVNDMFGSSEHGLQADFLKVFGYVCNKYSEFTIKKTEEKFYENVVETDTHYYKIDMSLGIPRIIPSIK